MTRLLTKDIILAAAIGCMYILVVPAFIVERSSIKEMDASRQKLKVMSELGGQYSSMKGAVEGIEQKRAAAKPGGVAQAIDSITSPLGLKGKTKSIKVIGSREIRDAAMVEEAAEVQMERITMNELVNMFHMISNAPFILSIKRASMKKSFENPELLDINMTVALFVKK